MHHDLHPEALADKMSSEQRLNQFVIKDPAPVFEVVLILVALFAAFAIAHYAEAVEAWLMGLGL